MAKVIIFPTGDRGAAARREALERAVEIQRAIGGRIVARPIRSRPWADPDGDGPRAA